MTTLDAIYDSLAARARTLTGLDACARSAAITGVVTLALGVTARLASWPILGVPGVSLALVAVAGAVGYVIGRARQAVMSEVLLRADAGLGTEARLCTLYAIRARQDLRPFAARIIAGLPAHPVVPRVALPVPRRVVALSIVALSIAFLTLLLVALLPTPRAQATRPHPSVGSSLPSDAVARRPVSSPPAADAVRPQAATEGVPGKATASTSPLASSAADDEVAIDTAHLPTRPQSARSLDEALREIEARVAADQQSTLSDSELSVLQSYADAAPGPLAEALQKLLSTSTHDRTLAQLRAVLARPDVVGSPVRDDVAAAPDALQAPAMAAGAESASAPTATAAASNSLAELPSHGGPYPFFEDAPGGPTEITLVGSTLPSAIGTAGGYSYYVTKSVPVEPPVADPTAPPGTPASLSYDRATSIAAARALPSDVLEAVRAYFTQITEGGP